MKPLQEQFEDEKAMSYCPICFCLIKSVYDHQKWCKHYPKKTEMPFEELFGKLKR